MNHFQLPLPPYFSKVGPMQPELEDFYEDILGKSQRGLGISDSELCKKAGISGADWRTALSGKFEESTARRVAPVLGLSADALVETGRKAWKPAPVELNGLFQANTLFGDMRVNAYLAWQPGAPQAVVFDSGADAGPLLAVLERGNLEPVLILLTHSHGDHIADLVSIQKRFPGAELWAHEKEPVSGASTFREGHAFSAGGLRIVARHTPGHSPGGVTFVIEGLEKPVAVVGDAIFAGSMGGAPNAWKDALAVNREKILNLPEETILCPGHGPMTTVAEEKKHNPFYQDQT